MLSGLFFQKRMMKKKLHYLDLNYFQIKTGTKIHYTAVKRVQNTTSLRF